MLRSRIRTMRLADLGGIMARVGFRGVLMTSAMVAASLLASTVVAPAANAA